MFLSFIQLQFTDRLGVVLLVGAGIALYLLLMYLLFGRKNSMGIPTRRKRG